MIIDSAKYTCAGGHEINEDSYLCSKEKGIFIVADGLGGHSDGEKASSAAVEYFDKNCTGGYTSERISALLEGANTQVQEHGDGGKTTVAAAFIEKGNFIYANAGDSRVYYFRDGKIIAQTKDHSVCQASVDMGVIRPEDIRGNEDRSRLLKVLGGDEKLNIKKHYSPIRIQNGDAFLICTDGFWDYVYETEMEADLLKSDSADAWLKYMLKRNILRAQNKGDNYTAICGVIHLEYGDADLFEEIEPAPVPEERSGGKTGSKSGKSVSAPAPADRKSKSGKKNNRIPILIAGFAVIAAAVALAAFLNSQKKDDISDEPVLTTVSQTETTTETESEISEPDENKETEPEQGDEISEQDNEDSEQGDENSEQGDENSEQDNEDSQQGNENSQQGGGIFRQDNEDSQQGDGNSRQGDENSQQDNENSRQGDENFQQDNENSRQDDENSQQDNENSEQDNENSEQGDNGSETEGEDNENVQVNSFEPEKAVNDNIV